MTATLGDRAAHMGMGQADDEGRRTARDDLLPLASAYVFIMVIIYPFKYMQ